MLTKIKKALHNIALLLYPNRCPFCRKVIEHNEHVCKECVKEMPKDPIIRGVFRGHRCVSLLPYLSKYKTALASFKFKNKTQYAQQFANIMADLINDCYYDTVFDYVTFVPMHEKELKKRGYNQSELLAKQLSSILKIPYLSTLDKIKHTSPQHTLSVKDRRKNLLGAFNALDKNLIKDKTILLIDDIITTGSTLDECVKTLEKAKPQLVCCATLISAVIS